MYVGHLAAALLIQAKLPRAPLRGLLIASVASDLWCGVLMLTGVERALMDGPFVFAHVVADIPYSHSLTGTALVAAVFASWGMQRFQSLRIALALAAAAFSHYLLDALTHRPDMPLLGFHAHHDVLLGTNLALHPGLFFAVELACCSFAVLRYDRHNRRLWLTFAALLVAYTNTVFGFLPPPKASSPTLGAAMILVFAVATVLIDWAARPAQPSTLVSAS